MILQAALFIAGLTVASGSICCPPKQFNAFQYVTIVNSTTTLRALYHIVYDGLKQRYLISGDRLNNYLGTTKVIYDYQKMLGYSIGSVARTCTTFPLHGHFEDQENICVPSGAVSLGPYFYGYNRNKLASATYTYNSTTTDGRHQSIEAIVSQDDCVPLVSTTISTDSAGVNSLYVLGYNDFYPGIKDASVLDIPTYCRF
ncbi:ependymin-related protein 1-like [Haliotis rubra]|uniref:ependymin-related protein 1-like n=1 Tax=Haliotis rubra TaxID=36100 RepID=UPI001EE55843|nr:ependymin-related protein 1-like [Haliotis rubra]